MPARPCPPPWECSARRNWLTALAPQNIQSPAQRQSLRCVIQRKSCPKCIYKLCTYDGIPITPRQGPGYLVVRCHNTTPPDSWRPAGSRVAAIKTVSIRNADHEYIQLREQFLGMASLLPYLYRICWVELGDKIGIMTVPGQAGCQPVAHFLIPLLKYLSKYF